MNGTVYNRHDDREHSGSVVDLTRHKLTSVNKTVKNSMNGTVYNRHDDREHSGSVVELTKH